MFWRKNKLPYDYAYPEVMIPDIPRFGSINSCPKCLAGHEEFDRKYKSDYIHGSNMIFFYNRIIVTCCKCKYFWDEWCADHEEVPTAVIETADDPR